MAPIFKELFSDLWQRESIARFPESAVSEIDVWLDGAWPIMMLDMLRVKPGEDKTPLLLLDRDYKGLILAQNLLPNSQMFRFTKMFGKGDLLSI